MQTTLQSLLCKIINLRMRGYYRKRNQLIDWIKSIGIKVAILKSKNILFTIIRRNTTKSTSWYEVIRSHRRSTSTSHDFSSSFNDLLWTIHFDPIVCVRVWDRMYASVPIISQLVYSGLHLYLLFIDVNNLCDVYNYLSYLYSHQMKWKA